MHVNAPCIHREQHAAFMLPSYRLHATLHAIKDSTSENILIQSFALFERCTSHARTADTEWIEQVHCKIHRRSDLKTVGGRATTVAAVAIVITSEYHCCIETAACTPNVGSVRCHVVQMPFVMYIPHGFNSFE